MSEKNKIRLEPNKEILTFLAKAESVVAKMPAWKQGVLEASSLRTNSVPRAIRNEGQSE